MTKPHTPLYRDISWQIIQNSHLEWSLLVSLSPPPPQMQMNQHENNINEGGRKEGRGIVFRQGSSQVEKRFFYSLRNIQSKILNGSPLTVPAVFLSERKCWVDTIMLTDWRSRLAVSPDLQLEILSRDSEHYMRIKVNTRLQWNSHLMAGSIWEVHYRG